MQLNKVTAQVKKGDFGQVDAILLLVQGELLVEQYFNKHHSSKLHPLQSATKSVNALLVGILLDKRYLQSVEEPISRFFPDYNFTDSLKANIRVKDLLTKWSCAEEGIME